MSADDARRAEAVLLTERGAARQRCGDLAGAIALYREALAREPSFYGARGMLLQALLYDDATDDATLWAEQRRWAAQRAPEPSAVRRTHPNPPDPNRRLRVGFVSSDFRGHPVGLNMLPVYARLDRAAFEIATYAHVPAPDRATALFEQLSDRWRTIHDRSDREVADMVAADGIDVLVLLAGHADENRPFVARYRPAPVQISHHDLCTTAMPEIDCWIGDPDVTPRGGRERFSERVSRLPHYAAYVLPREAAPPSPLPALAGGTVTFGSFNAPAKITAHTARLWAGALAAMPGSRLLLAHYDAYREPAVRDFVRARFAAAGLAPHRLMLLADKVDRPAHLARYDKVDVALDTTPFNGATTTFEALLRGVPVVTLEGERFVGRCAAASLRAVGLAACVARDDAGFVARAVELTADLPRLAGLRRGLRRAVESSPICDADRHARHLGRLYRALWRRWCRTGLAH